MLPSNLIRLKTYQYAPPGKEPQTVTYWYETLNYWNFTTPDGKNLYLHKQEVINNIEIGVKKSPGQD